MYNSPSVFYLYYNSGATVTIISSQLSIQIMYTFFIRNLAQGLVLENS